MYRFALVLILASSLVACGDSPDPGPEPDDPPSTAVADETQESEAGRAREQERRERLREAMREHREQTATEQDDRASQQRERLRARREAATDWWKDSELAGELGLSEEQLDRIGEADKRRRQERTEARQHMLESRRGLSRALAEGDRDESRTHLDARSQAREQMAAAEDEWLRTVIDTLEGDQLERLRQLRPHALESGRPWSSAQEER